MRRLILTVAAVAVWALGGHFGLLAILLYVWLSAMTTANTAKTRATEDRVSALVTAQGQLHSQQGSTSPFQNLSQTSTGTAQPLAGSVDSGLPNNNTTSGASAGTAHTHGMQNHTHNYEHEHFTQVSGDYDTLVGQLNQMRSALIAAGIL